MPKTSARPDTVTIRVSQATMPGQSNLSRIPFVYISVRINGIVEPLKKYETSSSTKWFGITIKVSNKTRFTDTKIFSTSQP